MKDSAPRCEHVADKLVRLFGWRQTYPVQKLQRSILPSRSDAVSASRVCASRKRGEAPRCEHVADKLVRLFGWRQTYPVQKLQRSILPIRSDAGAASWVEVRALRASSGGILDPDDRVRDVADDRETLSAECAGAPLAAPAPRVPPPPPRHHGGDGASGSSVGTASPDIFREGSGRRGGAAEHGVEVAAGAEEGGAGLQVRRGSEPSLHQDTLPAHPPLNEHTKRWSAAVVCRDDSRHNPPPPAAPAPAPADPHHFQRHSNRLSMQFSAPGSGTWLEAAERVQSMSTKSLPRDSRKEPLGQDTAPPAPHRHAHRVEDMLRWVSGVNGSAEVGDVAEVAVGAGAAAAARGAGAGGQLLSVALVKGERGLGFTITTRDNPTGGHAPIYIKNILPKGAAVTDGRLRAGDRLVSVNGVSVSGLAQQQVVSVLRNTPTDSTVTLLVERQRPHNTQRVEPQQSPAKYTEKAVGSPNSVALMNQLNSKGVENGRVSGIVNALNHGGRLDGSRSQDELNHNASDATSHSSGTTVTARNRLVVRLEVPVHDSEKAGLGISVKGKVTVGADPQDLGIFIKSVLHGGAASRDGRLHTNDQLLSVNGVSLVGQSNAEAMESLRRALVHSRGNLTGNISLTIARRTESMDSVARWKDDTPPTDSSADTVLYSSSADRDANFNHQPKCDNQRGSGKRHASIVTIDNNGSRVSNLSDDSKGGADREREGEGKRDSFEWGRLDGWNPVIDRLTGLRNDSYYIATQGEPARPREHPRAPPLHNVIIEEDYSPAPRVSGAGAAGGVYESGSECGAGEGFSRDAVGRRSMSEKRHAAVDARTTGTYKKIKEQKAINALGAVGPTLGMRKSSSLESLQTAVQEQRRHPHHPHHPHQPPLKHWLTDEAPAGGGGGAGGERMVRGSPQQSSLSHKKPSLLKSLSSMLRFGNKPKKPEEIYGRAGPGRASEKSLSRDALERSHALAERTLSERGQSDRGHPERGHPERGHSERGHPERGHSERGNPERGHPERGHLERGHPERGHSERGLSERGLSERGLSERGHSERTHAEREHERRQSERGQERLAGEARVPEHSGRRSGGGAGGEARPRGEDAPAPPYRLPPARTAPAAHTLSQVMEGAWGASGHYVNYEEIQHNLNARREKLSEVQIGQMRRTVHAQRAKADEERCRAGAGGGYHSQRSSSGAARPQSNYYEYESLQPHPAPARRNYLHYH